jgi:hypothetical protein
MKPYPFPSHLARKLKPAFDELQAQGFLASAEVIKVGTFTRVRFVRANGTRRLSASLVDAREGTSDVEEPLEVESIQRDDSEPSKAVSWPLSENELLWEMVLGEFQRTLPSPTYAMLANSMLIEMESGEATVAVDARCREWVALQMGRQIKTLLNQHLETEQWVNEVRFSEL